MHRTIGVAEVKRNFSEVVSEVSKMGEHFIIERKGKPMAAMVSIKELEIIEKQKAQETKKGLLAALGAWEDFKDLDKVIKHIYKKRGEAKERKLKGIF